MRKRSECESAFTLLEMLISLVVVSVVALSLYSSLRIGFKARKSALEAIEPVQSAEAAVALLERDLESALPPTGLLAGEFIGEDAVGDNGLDSDILTFHTSSGVSDIVYPEEALEEDLVLSLFGNNLPRQTGGDMQQVEFSLIPGDLLLTPNEEDGTESCLVRSVTKNLLAQTTPEPEEQIICRNVLSFNVRYLDGSEWVDSWDSTQQEDSLPPAVEVSLELRATDPEGTWTRDSSRFDEERSHTVTVVFLLPCVAPPAEDENQFIR